MVTPKNVENQPISVKDAASWVNDGQFLWREADGGARLGFTRRGRIKLGSEIFGFSVAGEVKSESAAGGKLKSIMASEISAGRKPNPKYAARRKWKGVAAEREGTHVYRAAGSVKSGPHKENFLPNLLSPWKIADERNQELKGANRGLGGLKKWNIMPQFFFSVLPSTCTTSAVIGVIFLGPWGQDPSEEGRSVMYLEHVIRVLLKFYLCHL